MKTNESINTLRATGLPNTEQPRLCRRKRLRRCCWANRRLLWVQSLRHQLYSERGLKLYLVTKAKTNFSKRRLVLRQARNTAPLARRCWKAEAHTELWKRNGWAKSAWRESNQSKHMPAWAEVVDAVAMHIQEDLLQKKLNRFTNFNAQTSRAPKTKMSPSGCKTYRPPATLAHVTILKILSINRSWRTLRHTILTSLSTKRREAITPETRCISRMTKQKAKQPQTTVFPMEMPTSQARRLRCYLVNHSKITWTDLWFDLI
jgi:hypothetical protein